MREATEHSPAQLRLLRAAAARLKADAALALLQSIHVGIGAVMVKGNRSAYERLQSALIEGTK